MKKVLLTMLAAVIVATSFAQISANRQPAVKPMKSIAEAQVTTQEKTFGLHPIVKNLQAPAKAHSLKFGQKKALRRAEGEFSVEDLAGDWIQAQYCYDYDQDAKKLVDDVPARAATTVAIEPGGKNTVTIYGLFDSGYGITGTVNLDDFTITIPANQTIGTSSYGDVTMMNASSDGDFTATIYADGIVIEQLWAGMVPYNGSSARYTPYYSSVLFFPNATMQYINSNNEEVIAYVAAIQDEDSNIVSVYNFGDFGVCVDAELLSDKTFSIDYNQVVDYSSTAGEYYPFAVSGNSLLDLVGKGTATTLKTEQNWTFYAFSGYWWGEQQPFTIELIDGTEFVYPEVETGELVTAPAGLKTTDYPFTAKYYDATTSAEEYSATVKVGWSGTDVYFQGLDRYLPEAWVKGTYNAADNTVTIPVTFTGVYEASGHFFAAYGAEEGARPLTINYDADANTFDYPATVMVYKGTTGTSYNFFYNGFFLGTKPSPVTPPAGLATVDMPFNGNYFSSDAEEAEAVTGTVKVVKDGNDLYIHAQDLFSAELAEGWMKGTTTTSEGSIFVIFAMNQYVGDMKNGLSAYLTGYLAAEEEGQEGSVSHVIFLYNAEEDYYTALNPVILTRFKSSITPEAFYQAGLTIGNAPSGINSTKANAMAPEGVWYSISGQRVAQPTQKGIYIHNGKKIVNK